MKNEINECKQALVEILQMVEILQKYSERDQSRKLVLHRREVTLVMWSILMLQALQVATMPIVVKAVIAAIVVYSLCNLIWALWLDIKSMKKQVSIQKLIAKIDESIAPAQTNFTKSVCPDDSTEPLGSMPNPWQKSNINTRN